MRPADFLPDAWNGRKLLDILGLDRLNQIRDRQARQHAKRKLRADARHAGQQQKRLLLALREKAEELDRIFPEMRVNIQRGNVRQDSGGRNRC